MRTNDKDFVKKAKEGKLFVPDKADDEEAEGKTYSVAEPEYVPPQGRRMESRELFIGIVTIPTVNQMADEIGGLFEEEIWSLKADIFETMKKMKMIPEEAEGPDFEGIVQEVLDELWRRA